MLASLLIVLVVAVCRGLVLGRMLPTVFLPLFLVLALGSVLDILLLAAMAEYWRRRAGSLPLALAPVVVGLAVLAPPFELVEQLPNLPLVPFLTAGWLASEGWHRLRRQNAPPRVA